MMRRRDASKHVLLQLNDFESLFIQLDNPVFIKKKKICAYYTVYSDIFLIEISDCTNKWRTIIKKMSFGKKL